MHRSGTSLIARLLKLSGLNLGPDDRMFGPNEGNPDGHFEHIDFLRLDETLLSHLGGSWEFPPLLNPDWQNAPELSTLRSEAKELIRSFPVDRPWGWKEPRTALILPFWTSLIPSLKFVICVRNPLDVAKSLAKRNGMTIEHGICLWTRYIRDALRGTQGYPRRFVFYDDLFVSAAEEIRRLAMFCSLQEPLEFDRFESVISPNLRHHVSSKDELLENAAVACECKLLYLLLTNFVRRASVTEHIQEAMDTELAEFLRVSEELFSDERGPRLQTMLDEKNLMLAAANFRLDETLRMLKQIEGQYSQLQQQAEHLQKFADEVKQSSVYRFYRSCVRPLLKLAAGS
jgi:hypothetical protein